MQQPIQKYIVDESSHNIRAIAREALAGKWGLAFVAVFIYSLVMDIPVYIIDDLFGFPLDFSMYKDLGDDVYVQITAMYEGVKESPISGIYTLLVSGPFMLGLMMFFVHLFRRQEPALGDTFAGFERFGKAFLMYVFITVFTILWAIIPIAGIVLGVIAAIRYSQAWFVMIDHPELSVAQCVRVSKMLMAGNKAKYFCLNLSFIGWMIVAALPGGIIEGVFVAFDMPILMSHICSFIANCCSFIVLAYVHTANLALYELMTGKIGGAVHAPYQTYTPDMDRLS